MGRSKPLCKLVHAIGEESLGEIGFVMFASIRFLSVAPSLCLCGLISHYLSVPFVSVNQVSLFELLLLELNFCTTDSIFVKRINKKKHFCELFSVPNFSLLLGQSHKSRLELKGSGSEAKLVLNQL